MRRQEEADREHEDPERDEEMNEKLEEKLEGEVELDEEADEEPIPVQRGEIEHAEKGRSGDVGETDDRVAWTEDDGGTDTGDRRK